MNKVTHHKGESAHWVIPRKNNLLETIKRTICYLIRQKKQPKLKANNLYSKIITYSSIKFDNQNHCYVLFTRAKYPNYKKQSNF